MSTDSIRNTRKKLRIMFIKLPIKTLRNENEVALMFFSRCFSVCLNRCCIAKSSKTYLKSLVKNEYF